MGPTFGNPGIAAKERKKKEETPGGEPLWRVSQDLAVFPSALVQPKNVKAGGSRERPNARQLCNVSDIH
jgi:hypothetical protein